MLLTPAESDRLLIFTAAQLARTRRARGLLLNVPETIAVVADAVCEAARDGRRYAETVEVGRAVLGPRDVRPGVAETVDEVRVEAAFDDGVRLVVVPRPVGDGRTGEEEASAGSRTVGAPRGRDLPCDPTGGPRDGNDPCTPADPCGPGQREEPIDVVVVNTAAVPVRVSGHFHFFEVNPRLRFDRAVAYGRHLEGGAEHTVRFEPGEETRVRLVPFRDDHVITGFSGLLDGPLLTPGARDTALIKARTCGYLDVRTPEPPGSPLPRHSGSLLRERNGTGATPPGPA